MRIPRMQSCTNNATATLRIASLLRDDPSVTIETAGLTLKTAPPQADSLQRAQPAPSMADQSKPDELPSNPGKRPQPRQTQL